MYYIHQQIYPETFKRHINTQEKTTTKRKGQKASSVIDLLTIINQFKGGTFLTQCFCLIDTLSLWYSHSGETTTVMRSTTEPSATMMEETVANPLSRPRR